MSPTVLRVRAYQFYFFSREEMRPHVHVQHATGEAKIWLDPRVELAQNCGLTAIRAAVRLAQEHEDEIRAAAPIRDRCKGPLAARRLDHREPTIP